MQMLRLMYSNTKKNNMINENILKKLDSLYKRDSARKLLAMKWLCVMQTWNALAPRAQLIKLRQFKRRNDQRKI